METATRAGALVLLTRMSRLIHRQVDPDELGMSMKEFSTLNFVRDADGVTQQGARHAHVRRREHSAMHLLDGLENRGFAVRERDPQDRRRHVVRITRAGTRALVKAEAVLERSTDDILGPLGDDERCELRALLAKALGDGASAAIAAE